jgi:hypothetical protein
MKIHQSVKVLGRLPVPLMAALAICVSLPPVAAHAETSFETVMNTARKECKEKLKKQLENKSDGVEMVVLGVWHGRTNVDSSYYSRGGGGQYDSFEAFFPKDEKVPKGTCELIENKPAYKGKADPLKISNGYRYDVEKGSKNVRFYRIVQKESPTNERYVRGEEFELLKPCEADTEIAKDDCPLK